MFLLAGIPQHLQNYDDEVSQSMTPPSLPEDLDELSEARRDHEEYLYRCRLVHYHYVNNTRECNLLHYAAITDHLYGVRARLFQEAGAPWEGESFNLKIALIEATEKWNELAGGDVPCPIEFDAKDLHETEELSKQLRIAERGCGFLGNMCDLAEEGWVLPEGYEFAMSFLKDRKAEALAGAESEEEREEILNHWPYDDMDEKDYM